jgi:transmembrane sensor
MGYGPMTPPIPDDSPDWPQLERYFAEDATAAERARIDVWLAAHPEQRPLLETLRLRWEAGRTPAAPDARTDASLASLHARMRRADRLAPRVTEKSRSPRRTMVFAAGALAACAALWLVVIGRPRAAVGVGRVYATAAGERETVTLADGTRFVLAPATTLRLGPSRRDVYLDGEAFFAVAHDARRPFVVHAANAVVQDIGTQFEVRHYRGSESVDVVVAEGMVAAGDSAVRPALRVMLQGGESGRVDRLGRTVAVHGVDASRAIGWTGGVLTFDAQPLRDVIPVLDRWYDIDIHLADSTLAARSLTATYGAQSIDDMLVLVTSAVGASYRRDGRSVTIYASLGSRP